MGGTCYAYSLMLAYNQFSSNTALADLQRQRRYRRCWRQRSKRRPENHHLRNRRCAHLLHHLPSPSATKSLTRPTTPSATTPPTPGASEYPSNVTNAGSATSTVTTQIYAVCQQLAALESAYGYSSSSRPLLLHCIAFGPQGTDGPGGPPANADLRQHHRQHAPATRSSTATNRPSSATSKPRSKKSFRTASRSP